jgi:hypothetical protein
VVLVLVASGCGQASHKAGQAEDRHAPATEANRDHSGWWCAEHGVPESECSMCNGQVAAECKRNGDWCDAHDRAKSQCYICNPSAKERYDALYRAKEGKEPPEPTDNRPSKVDKR